MAFEKAARLPTNQSQKQLIHDATIMNTAESVALVNKYFV